MIEVERRTLKKFSPRSLFAPVRLKATLSQIFHENTKLGRWTGRAYATAIESFLRSREVRDLLTRAYKVYTLMDREELPAVEPRGPLEETMVARRSIRRYTGEPITREELARLLFLTYGRTVPGGIWRPVASGGALYPLELYVLALEVEGLPKGIYHYDVENHGLDAVERRDCSEIVRDQLFGTGLDMDKAAAVVIFTAVFRRNTAKYLDRGYRLILMEAGAAAHNLSLLATSMGLGHCQLGGFLDDVLSETLGLDGIEEAPLLPVVLGRRPAPEE